MKRIMRSFKLNEISAVDSPAQAHARMLIMKRAEPLDKQIEERLAAELADEVLKAHKAATKDDTAMTDEIKKAVDAAVAEVMKEIGDKLKEEHEKVVKLECENAILKMPEVHKAYLKSANLAGEAHDAFIAKSEVERDVYIAANPIEKALPAEVQKQLAEAADLKKRLASLEEDKEVAAFAKRAIGLGLEEGHGEVLRKAYSGDAAAIGKLEQTLKGLAEQVRTGKVFAEFGSTRPGAGETAKAEIDAKAADYQKGQMAIGKKCTKEQAFTAVYTDPANADLKKRYDAEDFAKRNGVAA